jgi:hypothetical protein
VPAVLSKLLAAIRVSGLSESAGRTSSPGVTLLADRRRTQREVLDALAVRAAD